MAKAKAKNYEWGPWIMKENEFSGFTLVTDLNRKNAIILGRVVYIISIAGKDRIYRGHFDVRPRMVSGKVRRFNHPFLNDMQWFSFEEDKDDWASNFKALVDTLFNEKSLYIKLSDTLVKYQRV